MFLRNLSIRTGNPGQGTVALEATEAGGHYALPSAHVPAIPRYVLSLLYPEEAAPTDLVRLCGSIADAGWRATFSVGRTQFRISRGFSASTATLELMEEDGEQPWRTVARGVTDVKIGLARLVDLPPLPTVEALCFGLNPLPMRVPAQSEIQDPEVSQMTVQSNEDFTADMGSGPATRAVVPLDDETIARLSAMWRNARTSELLEQQLSSLQTELDEHLQVMNRAVDSDGTLSRLQAELARIPTLRTLTESEREALSTPPERIEELRMRLEAARNDIDLTRPPSQRDILAAAGLTAAGALLAGAWTVSAFTTRTLHLLPGNLFPLSLALFGALRWIGLKEATSLQGRKAESAERRAERLQHEVDTLVRTRAALEKEFTFSTLTDFERAGERVKRLKAREAEILASKAGETASPEYQKALRKKERLESDRDLRRRTLARIEETPFAAYQVEADLLAGGIDPAVALWCPQGIREEMRSQARRLMQVASEQGVMPDGRLQDAVVEAWTRLASRMCGHTLEGLRLMPDGGMRLSGDRDVFALSHALIWLVVEGLRISLYMTILNAQHISLPRFAVRVHSLRLHEDELVAGASAVYASVSRKVQLLSLDAREG